MSISSNQTIEFLEKNNIDLKTLISIELKSSDFEKINKEIIMDSFFEKELSFETLKKIDEETKMLFPSYFIRLANIGNLDGACADSLKIMLENGSSKAYQRYKTLNGNDLSKMSDEFLILGVQNGDGYEERDVLMKRYSKSIAKMINIVDNRYYFRGQEKEDLIQEANIGLMKAIEVFKVELKTKFKDFSKYVIKRHLGTLMYRSNNQKNKSLNESISYNTPVKVKSSGHTTTFEELIEGEKINPDEMWEKKTLYRLIKTQLTENEKEVLYPYADGYTYEEIAYLLIVNNNVMDFKGLSYLEVSRFLKTVASQKDFESVMDFKKEIATIPETYVGDDGVYLCGYNYNEIHKELKRRKKSVDNTIQRMRAKGAKQKFTFENDGKVWIDEEMRSLG